MTGKIAGMIQAAAEKVKAAVQNKTANNNAASSAAKNNGGITQNIANNNSASIFSSQKSTKQTSSVSIFSSQKSTKQTSSSSSRSNKLNSNNKDDKEILSVLDNARNNVSNDNNTSNSKNNISNNNNVNNNSNAKTKTVSNTVQNTSIEVKADDVNTAQIVDNTVKTIENLSNKYNFDIDIDNITESETELLQKLNYIDSMPDVSNRMNEYFTTLGTVDDIYDGMKTLFNWRKDGAITKEDVEQFAKNEGFKKETLINSLKNQGKLVVGDTDDDKTISKETISYFAKETMASLDSFEDMFDYAQNHLGISNDDTLELVKEPLVNFVKKEMVLHFGNNCDNVTEGTDIIKGDDGKYYISAQNSFNGLSVDDFLFGNDINSAVTGSYKIMNEMSSAIAKNAEIENGEELSFENLYGIFRGVEYNEEAIKTLNSITPLYNRVAEITDSTLQTQEALCNSSPFETFEYFNKLAKERNDGTSGADLFNEYYSNIFNYANSFEESPLSIIGDSVSGLTLNSVLADEKGNITEIFKLDDKKFAEYLDTTMYSYDEETGLVTRNISLYYEDMNGERQVDYRFSEGSSSFDTGMFGNLNGAIYNNNLYFNSEKNKFNEILSDGKENPTDLFGSIPEAYREIYDDSAGVNVLEKKLNSYIKDMDSYTSNLSQAISIGGFVLSWVPGMQAAGYVALAGACSDNVLDGINIASNSSANKSKEVEELASRTAKEGVCILAGIGINAAASKLGSEVAANYILGSGENTSMAAAKAIKTGVEYTSDVAASVGWDVAKYAIENGGLPSGEELNALLLQDVLFNSADLRAGMALYRAKANPNAEVQLFDNKTIKYNDDGSIHVTKQSGDSLKFKYIDSNDNIVSSEANTGILRKLGADEKYIKDYTDLLISKNKDIDIDNEVLIEGAKTMGLVKTNYDGTIDQNSLNKFLYTYDTSDYEKIAYLQEHYPDLGKEDFTKLENAFKTKEKMMLNSDNIETWMANKEKYRSWAEEIKLRGDAAIEDTQNKIAEAAGVKDIEGATITSRAKGIESIYDKISRKVLNGTNIDSLEKAITKINDLEGTRIVLTDSSPEVTHQIALNLAKAIEDDKIVITEIHNYSNGTAKYWSDEDVNLIKQASAKKGIEIPELANEQTSKAGYITAQFNVRTVDDIEGYKNAIADIAASGKKTDVSKLDKFLGEEGETQIRGKMMNICGDYEHLIYDSLRGKNLSKGLSELEELYAPIIEKVNRLKRLGLYDEYNEKVSVANYQIAKTVDDNMSNLISFPELPDSLKGFEILTWQNLDKINVKAHKIKKAYGIS